MNHSDIISAWATIRKTNNTIPDDVLDFMKLAALEKLNNEQEDKLSVATMPNSSTDADQQKDPTDKTEGERKFTLQEMVEAWDAGYLRKHNEEFGTVPTRTPTKWDYFKEEFNIDL